MAYSLSPSPARTVYPPEPSAFATRGRPRRARRLQWPDMPAGSSLDFWIDTSGWLPSNDPIVSAVPQLPAGLELVTGSILAPLVGLQLAGGLPATDYEVAVTITTAAGVSGVCHCWLQVDAAELADALPASPTIYAGGSSGLGTTPAASVQRTITVPYDVSALPDPAGPIGAFWIRVANATAPAVSVFAYSDGTAWHWVANGAVVS